MTKKIEDLEGEVWKPVVGYEGLYEVSNLGRVKSLRVIHTFHHSKDFYVRESIMTVSIANNTGYGRVTLHKNGIMKSEAVHRLVAKAFIPNPEGKPNIDHINTDKLDNHVENLRWVTQKENCNNTLTRINGSLAKTGRKLSEATKEKLRQINLGKHYSEEVRRKMSERMKGRRPAAWILELSNKVTRVKFCKPILQFTRNGEFVKEWHSMIEASSTTGISNSNIGMCCQGIRKTAGNYVWKYKNPQ